MKRRSSRARAYAPAAAALVVLGLALLPGGSAAQSLGYSPGDWHRLDTEHFEFLYPTAMETWATEMAERMESVHATVSALIDNEPEARITVLVDDPGNVSNGSMNPGPLLYMWPTPPNPRSVIGENRGWGDILAVHEYAHAAHLYRPSRNPRVRFMSQLLPVPVTNLMRITPRWVIEGYATYVEGRLTGSGRPHGVWRPAVLRTWALEGQLPSYGAMSGADTYNGGAMAYLMGSAYLEWLVAREGGDEEVLPNLWKRLTALEERSFGAAFRGVFGTQPDELYGFFTVDVTERALAVRDAVEAAGGEVAGELFQRYSWSTGDPAISPAGEKLALVRTSRDGPSRLIVINTTPDTLTTKQREAYEEIFERDTVDVEPVQRLPRAQRPRATLRPALGRAPYSNPAWMPDGNGILVIRSDVVANGLTRPDLYLWEWEDGGVRRITHGEAIRAAAPAPDGTWAVGLRCLAAFCDIVRVELDDGAVTTLARGTPTRPYYHPRVSPDGETIVATVQMDGGWQLIAMDADGANERPIGPNDGAARFDAEFMADGRLILTSDLGGIHDIEIVNPATGEMLPVTRVTGAAVAPEPTPDGEAAFFLSLHSRGWDLRRIALADAAGSPVVFTDTAAFPAATVPLEPGATFEVAPLDPPRPYGLGPRFRATLPMAHVAQEGYGGGVAVGGADPIGRLTWQLQGMYGTDRAPVGAALRLRWRGFDPWVHLAGFWTRHELPVIRQIPDGGLPNTGPALPPGPLVGAEETYLGGLAALELVGSGLGHRQTLRVGGSGGRLQDAAADRLLAFGDYSLRLEQRPGTSRAVQFVRGHASVGRTGELDWTRWRAEAGVSYRGERFGLGLEGGLAGTDAASTSLEGLSVGGVEPLLFDPAVLSQQIAMPALTGSTLRGREIQTVRLDAYGLAGFTSFLWAGRDPGAGTGWTRVLGTEMDQATDEIPYSRLPSTRIRFGLATILDGPDEGEWRAWLILGYQP